MDDFYHHVPAFGSWDLNDDLPFTQCFESARGAGHVFRYNCYSEDRDLYVAGDLYENDVVTPTMIVVPRRRRRGKLAVGTVDEKKEMKNESWVVVCDCKESYTPPTTPPKVAKAVDEDLYKISPKLLRAHDKRKKAWGFLTSCLRPTSVC